MTKVSGMAKVLVLVVLVYASMQNVRADGEGGTVVAPTATYAFATLTPTFVPQATTAAKSCANTTCVVKAEPFSIGENKYIRLNIVAGINNWKDVKMRVQTNNTSNVWYREIYWFSDIIIQDFGLNDLLISFFDNQSETFAEVQYFDYINQPYRIKCDYFQQPNGDLLLSVYGKNMSSENYPNHVPFDFSGSIEIHIPYTEWIGYPVIDYLRGDSVKCRSSKVAFYYLEARQPVPIVTVTPTPESTSIAVPTQLPTSTPVVPTATPNTRPVKIRQWLPLIGNES